MTSIPVTPASSTPVRPTAVELRRQKEVGDGSYDSPSVVVGSPERGGSSSAAFGFCAAGSTSSPGAHRATMFGVVTGSNVTPNAKVAHSSSGVWRWPRGVPGRGFPVHVC